MVDICIIFLLCSITGSCSAQKMLQHANHNSQVSHRQVRILYDMSVAAIPKLERSRRRRPLPSISLLRPPNLDSSRGNLPRHLLHLPQPLDRLLTAGIIPHHRRSPWEALEALLHRRSASPVILRPNRPREWICGEYLVLPGLFPLPLCAAGAGERPPPPHLLPAAARVRS